MISSSRHRSPFSLFFAQLLSSGDSLSKQKTQEKPLAACRELYKRFATWTEHYDKVGQKLGQMNDHYNASVGSFKNLNPQIKKLEELRINEDLGKNVLPLKETTGDLRALPESIALEEE